MVKMAGSGSIVDNDFLDTLTLCSPGLPLIPQKPVTSFPLSLEHGFVLKQSSPPSPEEQQLYSHSGRLPRVKVSGVRDLCASPVPSQPHIESRRVLGMRFNPSDSH